jgi:3-oxoacyl-[acyl-carrier protein] reductase
MIIVKYALVTGASGDIGHAICYELANQGYNLYIHYNQNKKSIDELSESLRKKNIEHFVVQSDFSKQNQPADLVNQIGNSLDLIVHNSGQVQYGLFTDIQDLNLQEYIHTNLTVPLMVTKALLPPMIQKKSGNILFITSIWGLTGASCEVLYSTIKGGLNTFVKSLSKELAPSGIRVNAIAPGAVQTKMLSSFSDEERNRIEDDIPMGRLGTPIEVANATSFLVSDQSSYVTGQILSINGGWYC